MKRNSSVALPLINVLLNIFILLSVVCVAQDRISSQKCAEYQSSCPKQSDPFNINGGEAASKEFPHMAAIGYENVYKNNGIHWLCTGSLISANFILSTAECTRRVGSLIPKYVRLGDSDIRSYSDDARPQQFNIVETFAHPSHSPGAKYNDIALFKVDGPVIFSEYMRPACLSALKPDNGERVLVTGWGTITYLTVAQGFEYAQMQKILMNTITNTECNQVFANRDTIALPNGIDMNTQLCAGSGLGERDACRGFSGAPLLNTKGKKSCLYEIYGLNSISLVCGSGYPSVYTRVSAFLDWIENIVWFNGTGLVPEIIPITHPSTTQSPKADRTFVKKCNEYYNSMFGANRIEPNGCTFAISPYIVDGEQAEPKEFPHMALVGFDDKTKIVWACGGSLISERFVLTAAHCLNVTGYGLAKYVLLGDLDYSRDDDDAQPLQLNVAEQIKYPTFTSKYKYNDIGLLRLETIVTFNEYIWPACLPEYTAIGFQATATGWGRLDNNGPISSTLRKVELDLYTHKECDDLYAAIKSRQIDRGILNDTQLCAGSHRGRGDTCQGDSGGPLQKFHDSLTCMYTIVGVTSFGQYCGSQLPGIYTRVFSYVDWIEGIVWTN